MASASAHATLAMLWLVVAGVTSWSALTALRESTRTSDLGRRSRMVVLSGLRLGAGVWAIQYLTLLVISTPAPGTFDFLVATQGLLVGLLGGVITAQVGFNASRQTPGRLLLGSSSLGLTLAALSYLGFASAGSVQLAPDAISLLPWYLLGLGPACGLTIVLWRWAGCRPQARGGSKVAAALSLTLLVATSQGLSWTLGGEPASGGSVGAWMVPAEFLVLTLLTLTTAVLGGTQLVASANAGPSEDHAKQASHLRDVLSLATETATMGTWDWDIVHDVHAWDPSMYLLYGLNPDDHADPFNAWRHAIHPDDLSESTSALWRAVDEGGQLEMEFRILRPGGETRWIQAMGQVFRGPDGDPIRMIGVNWDVTDSRVQRDRIDRLLAAFEQTEEGIAILDEHGRIEHINAGFQTMSGYSLEEAGGLVPDSLLEAGEGGVDYQAAWGTLREGHPWSGSVVSKRRDGTPYETETTISPVRDADGTIRGFVEVRRNVTEQRTLERRLQRAQKLESIGQLASGIAHDLNTPAQYVGDNIHFLSTAFDAVKELNERAKSWMESIAKNDALGPLAAEIETALEELDRDFLLDEVPAAISQSQEGVGRISAIVKAMKDFSHPSTEKTPSDLNGAIQSTVTVASHELRYVCDVELDLDPDLPTVECNLGEFNQVVLNLIVNAAHAIGDAIDASAGERGKITIRTRSDGDWVKVEVEDTGGGIPPEVQARVFDPFFTTKEVGKGTGQGLSMAHAVVVGNHAGNIDVNSTEGVGTTFTMEIPVAAPSSVIAEAEVL